MTSSGVGHLYPGPGTPDGNGIEGIVNLNGNGVYAADVEAIDSTTGNVVTETLTDPSGNYHLAAVQWHLLRLRPVAGASSTNAGRPRSANFNGQAGYGGNNLGNIPANPTNYTGKFY